MKEKIIVCDIDGVICDCSNRLERHSDWDAFHRGDYNAFYASMHHYNQASLDDDLVIQSGVDLVYGLRQIHEGSSIKFLTSRGIESYSSTLDWLRQYFPVLSENLIMNPHNQEISPGVYWEDGSERFCHVKFKRGEILKLLDDYDIVYALDDYAPICEMYQSLGINCLHIMWPNIDCLSRAGMTSLSSS